MKTLIASILIFFSISLYSQGLTQSTVRQIYDFHAGDTLEYSTGASSGSCPSMGNILRVILSRQDSITSVTYNIKEDQLFWNGYPCNNPHSYSDSVFYHMTYTDLDSSIFFYHTHALGCDSTHFCYTDSAFIDTIRYHSRKIDLHHEGIAGWFANDTSFADGLGEISGSFGSEDNTATQSAFFLIYYHMATGESWGAAHYFDFPNGIKEQDISGLKTSIAPNPVNNDEFQIKLKDPIIGETIFLLYDARGKLVKEKTIRSENVIMTRDNIAEGLYFWKLTSGGSEIDHGKIIFN